MERTLLIIKPDASELHTPTIISILEKRGFHILAHMQNEFGVNSMEGFYWIHREAPFFREHILFMCSGDCICLVLEAENAVAKLRELVGATDPKKAAPGTLRFMFGTELPRNAVHASDSVANAEREIAYLFSGRQLGQVLD